MQPGPGLRIWIVTPHADDEILGCGGLLSRIRDAGSKTVVLCVSLAGQQLREGGVPPSHAERRREFEQVMREAGVTAWDILFANGEHHLQLDQVPINRLINWLENDSACSLTATDPQIILLPAANHSNQDHRRVHEAMISVLRTRPRQLGLPRLALEYEIPCTGSTGLPPFRPNYYVNLPKEHLAEKCRLFSLYASQVAPSPHPRSTHAIETLAAFRGMEAGVDYAEAYRLLRIVIP